MPHESRHSEPELPSLGLVYDLAVKSYDYTDRRYDTIGTRAAALIGFTSLLVTGAATVVHRLSPYPGLKLTAALLFLAAIGYLLFHAIHAYRSREVKGLPDPAVIYQTYAGHSERQFRSEMVALLATARETYFTACEQKSVHLRKGLLAFIIVLGLLVPCLMLIPEPSNSGATHGHDERR